jgi:uncharacterized protein (TIGR00375 family)
VVSNIFSVKGRSKRIHTVLFAPSFKVAASINERLSRMGKLASDGRPIFGTHVKEIVKLVLDISPDCLIVPAHAWTPWFSLFGSESGFDSIEECFEEEAKNIYAIETGLSSDPAMNWRLSALDKITLISNSDSHSPSRIGREANVLDCALDYAEIVEVIKTGDPKRFLYTIEFFPAEGKYHLDGHRNCGVVFEPKATRENDYLCPVCGKKLTIGVMHRVEKLADRPEGFVLPDHIPFVNRIPLEEIIADVKSLGVSSQAVQSEYEKIIATFGNELKVLNDLSKEELSKSIPVKIVEGIIKVREGKVNITPGFDGEFGKIKIWGGAGSIAQQEQQLSLF